MKFKYINISLKRNRRAETKLAFKRIDGKRNWDECDRLIRELTKEKAENAINDKALEEACITLVFNKYGHNINTSMVENTKIDLIKLAKEKLK